MTKEEYKENFIKKSKEMATIQQLTQMIYKMQSEMAAFFVYADIYKEIKL